MKKRVFGICIIVSGVFLFSALIYKSLYTRKPLELNFDAAYFWPQKAYQDQKWKYEELASGYKYFLYLPEKYKNDKDNEAAKLPLIVTFHGSGEKGSALTKMGRRFISDEFQSKIYKEGAAVLVLQSRIDYFTDTHSMSLLLQNILIKNKCIDKSKIVGYGFSQGAKYVVELACAEPSLFKGVISGSGFYQIKLRELIKVLPVSFYSAISENDKGIFEQGNKTGKLCAKFCKNSRYVQYKERYHFWVELTDKTGSGSETMEDWLIQVVNSN